MLGILHFRKLTKMVGPTNATIRVNPHDYPHRPFRLSASSISTIRVNPHDYSPWSTVHKKTKRVLLSILLWLNICILVLFLLPLHRQTKAL